MGMAQIALYLAVLLPYFSDMILGLRGIAIGGKGWLLALLGPVGCVILCEICKLITKTQKQNYQAELAKKLKENANVVRMVSSRGAPTRVKSSVAKAPQSQPSNQKGEVSPKTVGKSSGQKGVAKACLP